MSLRRADLEALSAELAPALALEASVRAKFVALIAATDPEADAPAVAEALLDAYGVDTTQPVPLAAMLVSLAQSMRS